MSDNKPLNRLEAFSDGVFSIAITLLILDINLPHATEGGSLWSRLVAQWPSFFAFAFSFFVILVTWITHHDLLHLVRESSRKLQLANGFALLYVTVIPFVTGVLADNLTTSQINTAVALYCGTFVFGSGTFNILAETISKDRLLRPEVPPLVLNRIRRAFRVTFSVYAATTLIAFVQPYLALAINIAVRIFLLSIRYRMVPKDAAGKEN